MRNLRPRTAAAVLRITAAGLVAITCCAGQVALAEGDHHPLQPADTSSPRATLNSFIDSCNEMYEMILAVEHVRRRDDRYQPAIKRIFDCLDRSELPEFAREDASGEAAVCLKEVLDRIELPPDADIPDAEAIKRAGGGEKLPYWRIPGTRITITRVKEGPHTGEYLFSPQSVFDSAEFYRDAQPMPYRTTGRKVSPGFHQWYLSEPGRAAMAVIVHALPDWCGTRIWGLALWQWVGLLLSSVVALGAMYLLYRIGGRRSSLFRETSAWRYALTLAYPALAMLVPLAFRRVATDYLTLRGMAVYTSVFIANLVFLFALLALIAGATRRVAEIIIADPRIQPRGLDAQLIRIFSRLVAIVASIIVFLEGGRYLGFPLTTLLASAGVGGLAVALAAQDTLKSLFGSIMILLDKPYRVGERIIVDNYDGVVEEIGLRSTRLRLLTGHVAMIPNEEMAKTRIENVGRRRHIRRIANIEIPLDTPREKVEKAIEIVRAALENHEGMQPELPPRVFFNEFNPGSFNLRIIYWYHPPNYWDYLAFSEQFNLTMMRAFEEQGIQFSLPSRMTHTSLSSEQGPLEVKLLDDGREAGVPPERT